MELQRKNKFLNNILSKKHVTKSKKNNQTYSNTSLNLVNTICYNLETLRYEYTKYRAVYNYKYKSKETLGVPKSHLFTKFPFGEYIAFVALMTLVQKSRHKRKLKKAAKLESKKAAKLESKVVYKLIKLCINHLMINGQKSKSEKIILRTLKILLKTRNPLKWVIVQAFINISPLFTFKSVRRGGKAFNVPFPIYKKRQLSLGLSWLVKDSRKSKSKDISQKIALQFLSAFKNKGSIVEKRSLLHKEAKKARAFLHYRW